MHKNQGFFVGTSQGSHHRVFSDEYPYTRVSVIFQDFCIIFVLANLATSSIRVRVLQGAINNKKLTHSACLHKVLL